MTKQIYYIGQFPGTIGGITVRNSTYVRALRSRCLVSKFDLNLQIPKPLKLIWLLLFLFYHRNHNGIICADTLTLLKVIRVIRLFCPFAAARTKIITSGGMPEKIFFQHNVDIKILNQFSDIVVETHRIKSNLADLGVEKITVMPNCKVLKKRRDHRNEENEVIKFVTLSRIAREKGILELLAVDSILPLSLKFTIDVYGQPDDELETEFYNAINISTRINYCGPINPDKSRLDDILHPYDALLFPTTHEGEGYPGVVADAKVSGLAILTNEMNSISEILTHDFDALVLKKCSSELFAAAIQKLIANPNLLAKLRHNSYQSAIKIDFENYASRLLSFAK